jgi:CDP-diacylglycerol---serine O-phosphatidyltransferase
MIKKHIPNAITCCNLMCGCLAIVQVFKGDLTYASYLMVLAAIFDFFDGFVARILKVSSAIGKDLDSLADAVTFGVVPALMAFTLLNNTLSNELNYLSYLAFSVAVFSVIRLAKFNNDTRQSDVFIGLPTPANAMLFASLPLILKSESGIVVMNGLLSEFNSSNGLSGITASILNPYVLLFLCGLQSFLLVAELPLLALKFKQFSWKGNEIRYGFILSAVLLLILFKFLAIPLIIILYVLLSWLGRFLKPNFPTKM